MFTVALGIAPGAAVAESSVPDPLWYAEAMKIAPIHDAGITGKGITIAVFDGKINGDVAGFAGADIELRPLDNCPSPAVQTTDEIEGARHATSVTSLIVGNGQAVDGFGPLGVAPDARVLYYGALQEDCDGLAFSAALADAVEGGADIVTMSGGYAALTEALGADTIASVSAALEAGTIIVAGLPNEGTDISFELETINGVVNVASVDTSSRAATTEDGSEMSFQDVDIVGPGIDVAGVGYGLGWGLSSWSGNSAAAPLVACVLALAKQKWPHATSNQLLQSLIRNTGSQPHELAWSSTLGHGVVNATRMMEVDPSQYPDENPLFKDDQLPAYDDVYPEPEPTVTPKSAADAGPSVLPWTIGGGVVIVFGILLAVILFRVRRSRRLAGAPELTPSARAGSRDDLR